MNQNNDRDEFGADLHDKFHNICQIRVIDGGHQDVEIEKEVADFCWKWIQSYTKKKVEEERKKIFKDLIKVAGAGELEDLRREVTCYFKSKQQERLRKICEKNKDDMTGLYDYDGIVSGVLSILEEEQK